MPSYDPSMLTTSGFLRQRSQYRALTSLAHTSARWRVKVSRSNPAGGGPARCSDTSAPLQRSMQATWGGGARAGETEAGRSFGAREDTVGPEPSMQVVCGWCWRDEGANKGAGSAPDPLTSVSVTPSRLTSSMLLTQSRLVSANQRHAPFHSRRGSTPSALSVMAAAARPQYCGSSCVLRGGVGEGWRGKGWGRGGVIRHVKWVRVWNIERPIGLVLVPFRQGRY